MRGKITGVLLGMATGLLWAMGSPAAKILGGQGVSMTTVVLFRCLGTALTLGPCLKLLAPRCLLANREDIVRLFFLALLSPVCNVLGFMFSVVYLPVATALVIHYVNPFIVALASPLVTGEHPGPHDIIGALVVIAGVACSVMTPEWTFDAGLSVPGLAWALVAIFGICAQALGGRNLIAGGRATGLGVVFYTHLFGAFWMALYKSLSMGWSDLPGLTGTQWGLIAVPVLFSSILGFSAFYAALERVPPSTVALMTAMEVPGAVIMTAAVTGACPTFPEALGCGLILAAMALSFLGTRKGA